MGQYSILQRIEGAHEEAIWAADWYQYPQSFSEAGRIITGSLDDTVKMWEYQPHREPPDDLTCKIKLEGLSLGVVSVSVAPNGTLFATSSLDSNISVWDLETGEKKKSIDSGPLECWTVQFTRDSQHIMSGSGDGKIQLYNVETGKKEKSFETKNTKMALCLSTSPDSKWIACGSSNGLVSLLDESGNFVKTLEGHAMPVRALAFTPDSKFLITASDDKHIKIYSLHDFQVFGTLSGHSSWVLGLAVSPDGTKFASCSADKSVRIWDMDTRTSLHCFPDAHSDQIWSVIWSSNNKLISVGEDKAMNFYHIK